MKLSEIKTFNDLDINRHQPTENKENLTQYNAPLTGIEVEVENLNETRLAIEHSWQVGTDGSLRNTGREFILYPSKPKHIEEAINHLFNQLPPKAHFSPRTSIHVHLNCRDLTLKQIYNIVILYQCFEDLIYDFAGKERKKSIFCVPIGNTQYYNGFKGMMTARDTNNGWVSVWEVKGGIRRGASAAATQLISAPVIDRITYDTTASTWSIDAVADTTNGGLQLTVAGSASSNIKWLAQITTVEVCQPNCSTR